MTGQQILAADVIDILFEHRNKMYGAYRLRKEYPKELGKSLAIAVGFVFLFFFLLPFPSEETAVEKHDGGVVVVHTYELPPEQKIPETVQPPRQSTVQPVKQEKFIDQFKITKTEVVDPMPSIDMIGKAAVSTVTATGMEMPTIQQHFPESKVAATELPPPTPAPEDVIPDQQPQFPGGAQAWQAFLSRHLTAPETLESGEKRMVRIHFYVAEDGSVTNFRVVQSAGSVFDNEVIRVLKKMPKWRPALKNGRPIPVSFTQPVTFVGLEE